VINNFSKNCNIPPSDRSAERRDKSRLILFILGKLFGAGACGICSSTRLRRRALFTPSPPPQNNKQQKKTKNIDFLRYFLITHGKTPSAFRNGFFTTNQRRKEYLT